jgi:hypothetical protein
MHFCRAEWQAGYGWKIPMGVCDVKWSEKSKQSFEELRQAA